jgi:hypothetical protein
MEREATLRQLQSVAQHTSRLRPGLVWYASGLQIIMGGLLAFGPDGSSGATAASAVVNVLGGPRLAGAVLIVGAMLAMIGLYRRTGPGVRKFIKFSALQQATLIISAQGAFTAIVMSQYADGVPRPWAFIAADQSPYLWAVFLYTAAELGHHAIGVFLDAVLVQNGESVAPPPPTRRPAP